MISVVIPTYNEQRALPATLAHLAAQGDGFETFIVDGGSTDRTCQLALAQPRVTLLTAPKGRASQMNAGAERARGEWLLFLHADTLLPRGALAAIEALGAECQWGGFRHRFDSRRWGLRAISRLHNLRCRLSDIFYGDQAMFVRRPAFAAVGGFPPVAALEDIMLSERLRQRWRPALLSAAVVTDARKFVSMGVWRSFMRVVRIVVAHERGRPIPAREFFNDVR